MAETEGENQKQKNEEAQAQVLKDRVAIVTGGSRGIGRGVALHLASLGAKVVVNYNSDSAQADSVVSIINSLYGSTRAVAVRADVSDPGQIKYLFDQAEEELGGSWPVHILVNSAALLDPKYPSIANTSVDDFDRLFSVNAKGAFLCCREAANRLKRGGGGRIIMLSSSMVGALRPGFGPYTASKAAVEAMVKILAKELKGTSITANCVAPGPTATEMFFAGKSEDDVKKAVEQCPLGRLGQVEDVVPVVGFLASDASEWVNGQVIRVNGGYV